MSEHNPDCDINDVNVEGIRKPCNCGAPSSLAATHGSVTSCEKCGERIRGHSYLCDGRILCGLCLDDELNTAKRSSQNDRTEAFALSPNTQAQPRAGHQDHE